MDSKDTKYIKIGNNVKVLRERCGFNQLEVANYLGLKDHVTISYYERGERPIPFEHLSKIADLFGIELADLLSDNTEVQLVNRVFAFRKDELQEKDFSTIAEFNRIVKNYTKLKNLEKKHDIKA